MEDLVVRARKVLEDAQRPIGYRVPHHVAYPHQWLWDSSFHAIALTTLGDTLGAVEELEALFSAQTPSGFVPHMTYHEVPEAALDLWGRTGRSTITQPPMYGHALAVLGRSTALDDPLRVRIDRLVSQAVLGLSWLVDNRCADRSHQLVICHPWESGCDDSPRWDAWMPHARYERRGWANEKVALVNSLRDDPSGDAGASVANPHFEVADAGFTALFAFNCRELAEGFDISSLLDVASAVEHGLEELWDESLGVWVSRPLAPSGEHHYRESCRARTPDGLLGALTSPDHDRVNRVLDQLVDPDYFDAPFGPSGRATFEAGFEPDVYWRGPAWPQLSYLLYLGARRLGRQDVARQIGSSTCSAVLRNNFAEYWNPYTGVGDDAASPQTWSTIAVAMLQ